MKSMISEIKKKQLYYDHPTEDQVNIMYKASSGSVLSLSQNNRAEAFSWQTHSKNLALATKKKKDTLLRRD